MQCSDCINRPKKREKEGEKEGKRKTKAYSEHQMLIAAEDKYLNFCHKGRLVLPRALQWPLGISVVGPAYNHRVNLSSPATENLLKMLYSDIHQAEGMTGKKEYVWI